MVYISDRELDAVATYQKGKEVIAVRNDAPKGHKVCRIPRNELTCLEMFKHFFGFGKYAKYDFHLININNYLSQFDWKDIALTEKEAYHNACELGNKALFYKGRTELFDRVSTSISGKEIDYKLFQRKSCKTTYIENGITKFKWSYTSWNLTSHHKVTKCLKWNQAIEAKHVEKYVKSLFYNQNFGNTTVFLYHPVNFTSYEGNQKLSKQDLAKMSVNVQQKQTIKIDNKNITVKPESSESDTVIIINS